MLPSVLPTETEHIPVLGREVVSLLDPRPGDTIVDGTFGAGGHSTLLANRLRGDGKLIAIDRDPTVAPFFDRFRRETRHEGEAVPRRVLERPRTARRQRRARRRRPARPRRLVAAARPARARLLVRRDAPLDMRMDDGESGARLVNEAGGDLADIYRYGEERVRRRIARAIVRRATAPFAPTASSSRRSSRDPGAGAVREIHPAKRNFQALRIAVNDELGELERALPAALGCSARRPARRDRLPFARGPDRQAVPARTRSTAAPAHHIRPASAARAHAARDPAPGGASVVGRGRAQPARPVGAPARGDKGLVSFVTTQADAEPRPAHDAARSRFALTCPRRRWFWIAVSGILLAGVVFVNVLVLQLNLSLDTGECPAHEAARPERGAAVAVLGAALVAAHPGQARHSSSGSSYEGPHRVREPRQVRSGDR